MGTRRATHCWFVRRDADEEAPQNREVDVVSIKLAKPVNTANKVVRYAVNSIVTRKKRLVSDVQHTHKDDLSSRHASSERAPGGYII